MNNIVNITKHSFSGLLGINKSTLIYIAVFILVYLLNPLLLFVLIPFLTYMILMQVNGLEDKSNVKYLYSYLPVSKKDYVISRYLIVLTTLIFSIFVYCALLFVINTLLNAGVIRNTFFEVYFANKYLLQYSIGIFSGIFFSTLSTGVVIPLVLKYGSTVANYLGILVMLFLVMVPMLIFNDSQNSIALDFVVDNIATISLLSAIVVLFISYNISLKIYNKKEV